MNNLAFTKMHGLGNDFIIIDCRDGMESLSSQQVIKIADRRYGVGCDQVIHIHPPKSDGADIFLDMYNMDGSTLRACGNGTRCVAHLWMKETGKKNCTIETVAGLLHCKLADDDMVAVDMGKPKLGWQDIPLAEEKDTLHLGVISGDLTDPVCVNMGNPHTVFFVDNAELADVEGLGSQVERHILFPERTNVEFVQIISPEKLRVRVWERGAGVTQACGSGACASAVAAVRRGLSSRKVEVQLDGGSLMIEWDESSERVLMTGPVSYVFEGKIDLAA